MNVSPDSSTALCMVEGNSAEYSVQIEVDQKSGQLYFDCTCSYAENYFCKHMVAAALELNAFLKEEADEFEENEEEEIIPAFPPQAFTTWQSKLDETLAMVPRRTAAGHTQYVALVILARSQFGYSTYTNSYLSSRFYSLEPFIIKASEWNSAWRKLAANAAGDP